ncbi:SapC family protein [Catenovulum sediminis]|uniref:SapC family protein n=1 Tax=Catenovulum sediminis TaxID=1740262 RepID=A0ABV1RLQ8_9ALTE|nr:SapC family protein [Catenovulum sediminis]
MANHVLLNNVEHKDLKVITQRGVKYGDNVMFAPTFPEEFQNLQVYYPIVFYKDSSSGQLQPCALFGFEQGQNLFLNDSGWDSEYIPNIIQTQPFLIGLQKQIENSQEVTQAVLHIDLDSPRISKSEGTPIFLEFGGNSEYLSYVSGLLGAAHAGVESSKKFANMLNELELIEPFTAEIELKDGSKNTLSGFWTINEDKLSQLSAENLYCLNSNGYLKQIYMVIGSLSNFRKLIERQNKRLK